jgi:hypothetical protein
MTVRKSIVSQWDTANEVLSHRQFCRATLVRTYLVARGLEPVLPRDFRRLYWVAGACNALAGALEHHLRTFAQARTPRQQAHTLTLVRKWLRVIRRADASWRTG